MIKKTLRRISSATTQVQAMPLKRQRSFAMTSIGVLFSLVDISLIINHAIFHTDKLGMPEAIVWIGLGLISTGLISGEGLGGIVDVLKSAKDIKFNRE